MALIFSRQNNVGMIEETISPQGTILMSSEPATIYATSATSISIYFSNISLVFTCLFSDIQSINGLNPGTIGNAVYYLKQTFS